MIVNIRLNKNFTTAYNKMQEAYGEEINGFSDGQLSYTDFIDNFIDSTVVMLLLTASQRGQKRYCYSN